MIPAASRDFARSSAIASSKSSCVDVLKDVSVIASHVQVQESYTVASLGLTDDVRSTSWYFQS